MNIRKENTLFKKPFREKSTINAREIISEIKHQSDEYFESELNTEYLEYLISKYETEEFPIIHWEETQIEIGETDIYARDLPRTFDISNPDAKFTKKVVIYHVPVSNDDSLLNYGASNVFHSSSVGGYPYLKNGNIIFSFVDLYENSEKIDNEFSSTQRGFNQKLSSLENEIKQYNKELPIFIQNEIKKRVLGIERLNDYKSKFAYPLKKTNNIPELFKPHKVIKKKRIVPKPVVNTNGIPSEEKYITEEDYQNILTILQECGRNWESHPDTYRGKGEESLRDQLIFVLAPNIDGVVAGEAYNKKGKTDIAIKYKSTNLFIGECKIWKGAKVFKDTIDQILGYLTWRDSKSAIMMFVPNEDISNVKDVAEKTINEHPNFVRKLQEYNKGWSNYRFHIDGDKSSYLTIAVQLYHLPELKKTNAQHHI